jgi:hypothetical protein
MGIFFLDFENFSRLGEVQHAELVAVGDGLRGRFLSAKAKPSRS